MGAKAKKRSRRSLSVDLLRQVQRNLERGNFKQALKDAKVCYRRDPAEAHRSFLESAYVARAQELHRSGKRDECRAVVQALLELGVTELAVETALPELLVAVGMADQAPAVLEQPSGEDHTQIANYMADHAVLRPHEAPKSRPEMREGGTAVREALDALHGGDAERAMARLQDISRGSPFADWKFFVRGLAAYYRGDPSAMGANWDRLSPERLAQRICVPLRALSHPEGHGRRDRKVAQSLQFLEKGRGDQSVLQRLGKLQAEAAKGRWSAALRTLRLSRKTFDQFDPNLYARVADSIYHSLIHQDDTTLIEPLSRIESAPDMDPHCHRARALVAERSPQGDGQNVERHWLAYLDDVERLTCLSSDERRLACALIWKRSAENYAADAIEHDRRCGDPDCDFAGTRWNWAKERFQRSLKYAPELVGTYEELALGQSQWGDDDEACATYDRLLQHDPDHGEALEFLTKYYLERDQPQESRPYALKAHELKPLHDGRAKLVTDVHMAAARHYATQGECDRGRAEFEAVERLNAACGQDVEFLARRSIFEFTVGDVDLGEKWTTLALDQLEEPTVARMVLAIEAVRYGLVRSSDDDYYDHEWKVALKKRCRSQTAGRMCQIMSSYLDRGVDNGRQTQHVDWLVGYLRRHHRVRWYAADLRQVCDFLYELPDRDEGDLLEALLAKARKKFPEDAYFHFLSGRQEMEKGPEEGSLSLAISCFETVIRCGDETDPQIAATIDRAKCLLAMACKFAAFEATLNEDPSREAFIEFCEEMGFDGEQFADGTA